MACQWCISISEVVKRLPSGETLITLPTSLAELVEYQLRLRLRDLAADKHWGRIAISSAREFCRLGPNCDPVNSDPIFGWVKHPALDLYVYLLLIVLEVGFRPAGTTPTWGCILPAHTSGHEWVFEIAFSSSDDEVIADGVSMFIMNGALTPLDSFARYFTKRMERNTPFLPRLQQLIMRALRCIWDIGLRESGPETIRLLNRLAVTEGDAWDAMLEDVIHSPAGIEGLSLDYWCLMLESMNDTWSLEPRDIRAMQLLRGSKDWEKLEIWMLVVWTCLPYPSDVTAGSMEEVQEVTLELFSRRPSAIRRFEDLYKPRVSENSYDQTYKKKLQDVCDQARAETMPLGKPQTSMYVSPHPAQQLLILMSCFSFSQLDFTRPPFPLPFAGDDSF